MLDGGDVDRRLAEIAAFNAAHEHTKRALAMTPVKFGISFNLTAFNQAGALVHVYKDGSVLINHGGTEMGQGLHTKMLQVAATTLGVPLSAVRLAPTRTDKVPNTSATAASSGADLNGGAVKNACEQIRERLARWPRASSACTRHDVRFVDGVVTGLADTDGRLDVGRAGRTAYFQRVQLWAAGFYRTEGLHWDAKRCTASRSSTSRTARRPPRSRSTGSPAPTGCGGSTSCTTSATACPRWSTSARSRAGSCRARAGSRSRTCAGTRATATPAGGSSTQAASTYKLPSFSEMPEDFNVTLLEQAPEDGAVYGSKAVGEPPLMLAFSVREALRQAAAAFGPPGHQRRPGLPGHARGGLLGGGGRAGRRPGAVGGGGLMRPPQVVRGDRALRHSCTAHRESSWTG